MIITYPHFEDIAALLCETVMSQLLVSFPSNVTRMKWI